MKRYPQETVAYTTLQYYELVHSITVSGGSTYGELVDWDVTRFFYHWTAGIEYNHKPMKLTQYITFL